MSLDPQLLDMLRCPVSHQVLREAEPTLVERVNRAIQAGVVQNQIGRHIQEPLDGGLIRQDGQVLYPLRDGIPIMLADEGIALEEIP